MLSFKVETITPAIAAKALEQTEKAEFRNRPLSRNTIAKYAHEMRDGRWFQPSVEPIHFSELNGIEIVINGQNRLAAIIASKVPLKMLVVRGVPYEAFKYFDGGGNSRDLKDILHIDGSFGNTQAAATCMRMLFKEDVTGDPTKRPSAELNYTDGNIYAVTLKRYDDAIEQTWQRHMALLGLIERAETVQGVKMSGLGPKGVYLYAAMRAEAKDPKALKAVLEYLADDIKGMNPPKGWKIYAGLVREIRATAEGDEGKIVKGRHKDFSDALITAFALTWNRMRSAERAYSKASLIAALENCEKWPGIK